MFDYMMLKKQKDPELHVFDSQMKKYIQNVKSDTKKIGEYIMSHSRQGSSKKTQRESPKTNRSHLKVSKSSVNLSKSGYQTTVRRQSKGRNKSTLKAYESSELKIK